MFPDFFFSFFPYHKVKHFIYFCAVPEGKQYKLLRGGLNPLKDPNRVHRLGLVRRIWFRGYVFTPRPKSLLTRKTAAVRKTYKKKTLVSRKWVARENIEGWVMGVLQFSLRRIYYSTYIYLLTSKLSMWWLHRGL